MKKTSNYSLYQWEAGDRVTRADFNADNLAIDAALKSVADAAAGGVKFVHGSYTGAGTYGAANPNSLTFSFTPKALIVLGHNHDNTNSQQSIFAIFIANMDQTPSIELNIPSNTVIYTPRNHQIKGVTWSSSGLTWYSTESALAQMNYQNVTYYYVAFG